jgi:hypothetical protein
VLGRRRGGDVSTSDNNAGGGGIARSSAALADLRHWERSEATVEGRVCVDRHRRNEFEPGLQGLCGELEGQPAAARGAAWGTARR